MSAPTVVVLPASGEQPQDQEELTSTIQQALYEKSHPKPPEPESPTPLKQLLAHSDSLYKYINWEDPTRTLGLYIGALSILFGAHYLPLTQVALKAGVTTLGVVSVTEYASRQFSSNSLSARLRPEEYKKIPESTLSATLKDIHDAIQFVVVQAQRIVYGHDLEKTFAAFLGCTALYWLVQVVNPFWLSVLGLTSIFVAPLVTSPRGRAVAQNASARTQELANAAADKSKVLAQNGQAKAAELSSNAQQTASDLSSRARGTASDMSSNAQQTASNLSSNAQQTASDLSSRARGTASDMAGTASDKASNAQQTAADYSARARDTASDKASNAQQTASDYSGRARDTASDMSSNAQQTAADYSGRTRDTTSNMSGTASDNVNSAYGNTKQYISNTLPSTNTDEYSNGNGNGSYTGAAANKVSQLSNTASQTARQMAPGYNAGGYNAGQQPGSDHLQHAVSSLDGQTGGETGSVPDTIYKYAAAGDAAANRGIQDRSRGAAY